MVKIAVVGAGVIGLASALKIKEKYNDFEVVLISKDFTPNTTGDGSGGLWFPYICGDTPSHLLTKWGGETYKFLHELWLDGGHDISLVPVYGVFRVQKDCQIPPWSHVTFGFRQLDKKQLEYLSDISSNKFVSGYVFTTFVSHAPSLLSYLYERFRGAGGAVLAATVRSLQDQMLQQFDVVVNCTGVAARRVVPDEHVFPVRGQVLKVVAPWICDSIIDEDGDNYIIPNSETCVLGGTHQENDFNTAVDDKDTDFIFNGCKRLVPGLEHTNVVNAWVGLRPARHEVKLAAERRNGKLFIHNYGHGGSGLTLFWGCASDVLQILEDNINKIQRTSQRSKL